MSTPREEELQRENDRLQRELHSIKRQRLEDKTLTNAEIKRFSRQLLVKEIGVAGQLKLKSASVMVVGAGGLGSPIALYLAAAGIGTSSHRFIFLFCAMFILVCCIKAQWELSIMILSIAPICIDRSFIHKKRVARAK